MRDLLPDHVRNFIRDRYLAGVADAEAHFELNEADEDSVTGALGRAVSTREPVRHIVDGHTYTWKITYRKLRGRGPGAPEKKYGADGLFQIEVLDETGKPLRRKGLPFQAKKGWSATDHDLVSQAHKMLETTQQGIVIDYTSQGFKACPASVVIEARGTKASVMAAKQMQPLGQILGNEFLDCTIGAQGLFYDPASERFRLAPELPLPIEHVITTSIVKAETPS